MEKRLAFSLLAGLLVVPGGCGGGREEGDRENTPELCGDSIDNDHDDRIDCLDQDCIPHCSLTEDALDLCRDRLDNDMDGAVDCLDPDCAAFCRDAASDAVEDPSPDPIDDAAEIPSDEPAEDVVADDPPQEEAADLPPDEEEEEDPATECGNGTVEPGEECDDGNDDDHDACTGDCLNAVCGDGFLRYGYEDCDPPGSTRPCITECESTGIASCSDVCTWHDACEPPEEICNGLDDDCEDGPDNGFPCVPDEPVPCTTACGTAGTGTCTSECGFPAPADCAPPDETCNGKDDDCDGACDNGFDCCAGTTETCTSSTGLPGSRMCTGTCEWLPCVDDCPDACETIPSGGAIGAPCVTAATCDHAADCITEDIESFNGELYVSYRYGACMLYGREEEGCDPDVPATCPGGSRCIFLVTYLGDDYYGCLDACQIADPSGAPYDMNCGCREGYSCDMVRQVCMSGCSNDRECCERWWDLDSDGSRDTGEVVLKTGCTNLCDDEPAGVCQATHACINNGDAANTWSGPCEGDAWCPPDGRCLDAFNYPDGSTGAPRFPGGLCVKDACNLTGRGCSDFGGACANLGSSAAGLWTCLGTCSFGKNLSDPDYECRTASGEEQACFPVESEFWLDPPADGSDGFCWPGNFPGGTAAVGSACTTDADCVSPWGVGFCRSHESLPAPTTCSALCNRSAAETYAVCGGDDGTGTASGVCSANTCLESCDGPGEVLGANGCSQAEMACYPVAMLPDLFRAAGTLPPDGACLPACLSSAWCEEAFNLPMPCDPVTGLCG